MNYDNILDKFTNISELPVSEEAIGAYLEGNLSVDEQHDLEDTLACCGEDHILDDITMDEPLPDDYLSDDIIAIDVLDDNIQLPDIDAFEELYAHVETTAPADLFFAETAMDFSPEAEISDIKPADDFPDDLPDDLPDISNLDFPDESESDFLDPTDF